MRMLLMVPVFLAALVATPVGGQAPTREIDNVAAFARLYGVLRYFYPSDVAASLDWNRFAVHGVGAVRDSRDASALETSLTRLISPLGPGLVVARKLPASAPAGSPDPALVAWRYLGAAVGPVTQQGPYRAKRTNRSLSVSAPLDGFSTVMQTVPALALRGKSVRLLGTVRAEAPAGDGGSGAALWLRIDRPDNQMGFFDNMGNRPIRSPEWRQYEIVGTIAADATTVAFGAMVSGAATGEFDSIRLEVRDGTGEWMPVEIKDPGFEGAANGTDGWFRAGTSKTAMVTRPAGGAPDGQQFLRVAPPSPSVVTAELFEAPPLTGAHVDVDLGSGLVARVPLALSNAQATAQASNAAAVDSLRKAIAAVPDSGELPDVNARLADVAVAWNVFRHFYPYFEEAGVDWDQRLAPHLARARDAATRDAHRAALRLLVADVRDGHGNVNDPRAAGQGRLPIQLRVVEGRVAITASDITDAPVGAVVTSIGGVAAERRLADVVQLNSGSPQWKEWRALQEIATCEPGSSVPVVVDTGAGASSTSLRCEARAPAAEKRPNPIAEIAPGIRYVDLTRATMAQITPALPELSTAIGVVFDLRGYPTDAGFGILPYLLTSAETDRWMHVNRIVGPYGQSAGWQDIGWDHKPATPHLGPKVVFLTDGRAISYAESVMGYIGDRKLAAIVGAPTAGANGNVAVFTVPSGFRLAFTGMRVTGHDGRTPHHLAGVKPTAPAAPTLAGLRAGRDEVLERGIAVIRGQ